MAATIVSSCSCVSINSVLGCRSDAKSFSQKALIPGILFSRAEPRKSALQQLPLHLCLHSSYHGLSTKAFIQSDWSPVGGCIHRKFIFNLSHLYRQKTHQQLCVFICKASKETIGRPGTHERDCNILLASFGIGRRKGLDWKNIDFSKSLSGLLPYVVLATAVSALVNPASFAWVSKEYYAPALGGIMLSIGIQLTVKDFALAAERPLPVLLGYIAQYIGKPILGLYLAMAFRIPSAFAAGFLLMSSVSGAQLSSYASYLSEGDVALSIVLTSLSTITSVVVTPILTGLLIGTVIPVDVLSMAKSIMQVVLCPVMIGLVMNSFAKSTVDTIRPVLPLMAMFCTSICIGSPLALNRSQIVSIEGIQLLFPVVVFHTAAFAFGYWMSKLPLIRQDERISRTLSLSTGMQSSTLAGLLATQFLGGSHAVPAACSVVVMAVMGLSLASFWGKGNRICNASRHWIQNIVPSEDNIDISSPTSLRKQT